MIEPLYKGLFWNIVLFSIFIWSILFVFKGFHIDLRFIITLVIIYIHLRVQVIPSIVV